MPFISYAQNYEDVILWRALKHVKTGFYIDVGASDPVDDSVTKAFYDIGWRGINIEPVPRYFNLICEKRPLDINLQVAAGDQVGTIKIFDAHDIRGWGTSSENLFKKYRESGLRVDTIEVPIMTLTKICNDYVGQKEIHFLKIDVEGMELSVLRGMDFTAWRPWIIIIETFDPETNSIRIDTNNYMLSAGYQKVYYDGLNNFYVAVEHEELKAAFFAPPNVFDDFVKYREIVAKAQLEGLSKTLADREQQMQNVQAEVTQIEGLSKTLADRKHQMQNIQTELAQIRSWSMASSLRAAMNIVYKAKHWFIRWLLRGLFRFFLSHKNRINAVLRHFPWVETRLQRIKFYMIAAQQVEMLPVKRRKLISKEDLSYMEKFKLYANCQYQPTPPVVFPFPKGQRIIYYYVDHTIQCPVNTGIQRVTRHLGRAFMETGEKVIFVKWDTHHRRLVLLNREDLAAFSKWNGPSLSPKDLNRYQYPSDTAEPVEKYIMEEGHWLVVPEVPHITYHANPVTLDILAESKRVGLRSAFVFYDAIPLRRPDLADMGKYHEIYMQQLLLADLIVPISNWSERDLVSFFTVHERANLTLTPRIHALPLPGESILTARVTTPICPSSVEKMILSVGSIVPHKNQIALVQAFESYCQTHPGAKWKLVLVGSLHPDLHSKIMRAVQQNPRIQYLQHIPDAELDVLYRSCAFTVFPSIEEGFGLPIFESLWYAKPCVCAYFGAMGEIARGGGCLAINTRSTDELLSAITRMTTEPDLLERLSREAVVRPITTWDNYAQRFGTLLGQGSEPLNQMGIIYYWVDHTVTFYKNTGIQRVTRGLARSLLEMGFKLVPVRWDQEQSKFYQPSMENLRHLEKWNGPQVSAWSDWIDPSNSSANDWLLIPELVLYLDEQHLAKLKQHTLDLNLRCAWVFYDAVPWKMQDIFPNFYTPESVRAHVRYMEWLNEFELIFPISQFSRIDLISFLSTVSWRTLSLENRIQTCVLPGEFIESSRKTNVKQNTSGVIKILCAGTVEPRKNHLTLLQAYIEVVNQVVQPIELYIVGRSAEPDLAAKVQNFVKTYPRIYWEENADDVRLRELYTECDFTVYPSLEEGFGLPILESLWYACPCICRDSGAMREVAEGGGCLMVETKDVDALAGAMLKMIKDDALRLRLTQEAVSRPIKTWRDYALEVATRMAVERVIPIQQSLPPSLSQVDFYTELINLTPRPLLSICVSTYNRADWLAVSLKNLTRFLPVPRDEVEIVVCDNTSTDRTPDVVQPYLQRSDFRYYRNPQNVGMLGNLRVTAHHACGRYIWILGDDDLIKAGCIEKILQVIQSQPDIGLIYLNYAYTKHDDPKAVMNLDAFLRDSTPVVAPTRDIVGTVSQICTESENFFTAIYCLVYRRDHALRAYTQNTDGRPFSTMLTCIPTTYYTLNNMMKEPAYWIGTPQVVVNLNVSWMKYAPLWILERIPEVYDLAERLGADPLSVDRWRKHTLPGVVHWFRSIYEHDAEGNMKYFSPSRLITRMKHLDTFSRYANELQAIYESAYATKHPGVEFSPSQVFLGKAMEE